VTTSDIQRMKELERENKELRRANEILKVASAFFGQAELDHRIQDTPRGVSSLVKPCCSSYLNPPKNFPYHL
jgi:transposase-like protein